MKKLLHKQILIGSQNTKIDLKIAGIEKKVYQSDEICVFLLRFFKLYINFDCFLNGN